jgi:hypothetical protein
MTIRNPDRRVFVASAGAVAAQALMTSPAEGAPPQREPPKPARLALGPLLNLADLIGVIPEWTPSVLERQPDWTEALYVAALLRMLNAEDVRAGLAVAADRDLRAGRELFAVEARILFALDLMFVTTDKKAIDNRRYIEMFAGPASPPSNCQIRDDLTSVLCWAGDAPRFARAYNPPGGLGGAAPSIMHELDRRVASKCPFRTGLPSVVSFVNRQDDPPATNSVDVLIFALHERLLKKRE